MSAIRISNKNHQVAQRTFHRNRLTWASYWLVGYFAFLQTVIGPLMPL